MKQHHVLRASAQDEQQLDSADANACLASSCSSHVSKRRTFTPKYQDTMHGLGAAGPESTRDEQAPAMHDRGMLRPGAIPTPRVTADGGDLSASAGIMKSSIVACGVTAHTIETLAPRGSTQITLSFLPLSLGVQQLSGLLLQGSDNNRIYDRLQPVDVLVSA